MTAFTTSPLADTARLYAEAAAQAVAETLWPTAAPFAMSPANFYANAAEANFPSSTFGVHAPSAALPGGIRSAPSATA